MRLRTSLFLVTGALALGAGAGCGGDEGAGARSEGSTVAAAFYPLAWAAERVGGDSVTVWNVTPPGAEPHDVELSAREVARVQEADLVVLLGGGFQPALEEAARDAEGRVVDLLAGLPREPGGAGTAERRDPHVWLDPLRFAAMARALGAALDRPAAARRLVSELQALHRDFARGLARCERREIVTSHAAFGHLARRYDLDQIALTGMSPDAEVSARALEAAVDEVRRRGATTVFFETLVSPRLAETVARESGARTAVLDPIEGLGEDELARGEDYVSTMRANLAVLRRALACR